MTVRVNLLPSAYELRYQRARRLRRWVIVGSAVLALQVPAFVMIRQMGTQARGLQHGLQMAEGQRRSIQTRIDALTVQQADLDSQLLLAERLSRKHRWSQLFETVAACLPDTVVLTRVDTDPPRADDDAAAPALRVRAATEREDASGPRSVAAGLVIGGVAMDHDSVAVFLRNLNATGRVGRCSLESTMRQPFLKGEGVFFTVRSQW